MNTRQLRYFLAVIEYGSFTEAAKSLFISQPSLSASIQQLEKDAGTPLLDRASHPIAPTEAGQYLQSVSTRALNLLDNAAVQLRSFSEGMSGRVVLSSAPIFNWEFLPSIVSALRKRLPDVQLVVEDPPPETTTLNVIEGSTDIGIVPIWDMKQMKAQHGENLSMQVMLELPLVAALPPKFSGSPKNISLTQLQNELWLMPISGPAFSGIPELVHHTWDQVPGSRPLNIQETSSMQAALPLVAGGAGVTVLPRTVRHVTHRSIVLREIIEPLPSLQATVIWRRGEVLAPAIKNTLRLLTDRSAWKHPTR